MNRKGFTLIELLVVVMMVGILTSVALPQYRKAMKRARTAEVLQMLPALYEARERWVLENGYHWDGDMIKDANGTQVRPTIAMLDIEVKAAGAAPDTQTFWTENFSYGLSVCSTCPGNNGRAVHATLRGANTSDEKLTQIYYRGGKVCCRGSNKVCRELNIEVCEI